MLANPERGSTALGYNTPTWKPGWTLLSVFKIFLITALVCLEVAVLLIHWMDHSVDDDTNIFAVPDVLWTTPLVLVATHVRCELTVSTHITCIISKLQTII